MINLFIENRTRILTGLGLVGLILVIALINNFFLIWLFLGVIYLISFYETLKLFKIDADYLYAVALLLWIVSYFYPTPIDLIFLILIIFASVRAYNKSIELNLIYPFLYPTISFLFLLSLYKNFGMAYLIWLIIIVASTDTGAYFVGKTIGVTKFSPTSPKKTLEGVIGGVIIASIAGTFFGAIYQTILTSFIISIVVSTTSIFGDLFESYLKREANVKDSGTILPGHGGVLDRVDGYLFSVIVMDITLRSLT